MTGKSNIGREKAGEELAALVERARRGEPRAYDRLVRRFQDMAIGYAWTLLGDRALAEDAAQEAFLEAYRALPNLREPAAFPGWFRRIVFQRCDRFRRGKHLPLLPLEAAEGLVSPVDDPVARMETRETQERVQAAIRALPEAERQVTVLYYLGAHSQPEIAAFLNLPVTTIKNRLFTARRRLKERMVAMVKEELEGQRPSEKTDFADRVLTEIVAEYWRQYRLDPLTADKGLLTTAREKLPAYLQQTPFDAAMARTGIDLLDCLGESDAVLALLTHFLAQPITRDETTWARWHRINNLACAQRHAEAIAEQETFLAWVKATLYGQSLRLEAEFPFDPVVDPTAETLPPECLPIWALGSGVLAISYRELGQPERWLQQFEEAMAVTPLTATTRYRRFTALRMGSDLFSRLKRPEEALEMAERIGRLAEEETDFGSAQRWRIESAYVASRVYSDQRDFTGLRRLAEEEIALLDAYEAALAPLTAPQKRQMFIFCHNAAACLRNPGLYDLAVPLFRRALACGLGNIWTYLWLAACVWAASHDRAETLELLRQAACRFHGADFRAECLELPEFADLADDPEFLLATA